LQTGKQNKQHFSGCAYKAVYSPMYLKGTSKISFLLKKYKEFMKNKTKRPVPKLYALEQAFYVYMLL